MDTLFRWKHLANPFGRSVMTVAEDDNALIGFAAWLRWKVWADGKTLDVLRGVDVAADREYRGRGIHTDMVREGTKRFPAEVACVLSAPNALSRWGATTAAGITSACPR